MSQQQEERRVTDADRYVGRRRFLAATGAVAGTGVITGCIDREEPVDDDVDDDVDEVDAMTRSIQAARDIDEDDFPGLLFHDVAPGNAEARERSTYDDQFLTPPEEHYIRNHYSAPRFDGEDEEWEIELELGDGETETLTVADLKDEYSTETVTHTMQCSGNGRSYFDPTPGGNPWRFGAVGNGDWTGAPLSEVLEDYGAETGDGMWLMVAGNDHLTADVDPDDVRIFARSIPMSKVMEDCILAYEHNGEQMTADHGHPVRIVVPGWYGNNNVKWVTELKVMERMLIGNDTDRFHEDLDEDEATDWEEQYVHWQQNSYRMKWDGQESTRVAEIDEYDTWDQWDMEADDEDVDWPPYIYEQLVKSLIGYPGLDSTVEPREEDGMIEVTGVAWCGDSEEVDMVEVSTDGGETWEEAEFFGANGEPYGWRMFRYMWEPEEEGEYTLASRATDTRGRRQPRTLSEQAEAEEIVTIDRENEVFPWEEGGYCNIASQPHDVDVTVENV